MAANFLHAARVAHQRREEEAERNRIRVHVRQINHPLLSQSDSVFVRRFRFSKEAFGALCNVLSQHTNLKATQRMSLDYKVLVALEMYAQGAYQTMAGAGSTLSQKSTSRYIEEVTDALNHPEILNRFIKFPVTAEERRIVSQEFLLKYGIPGIIGVIDGSHVRITHPKRDEEHVFFCRKGYHSINLMAICDANCRILAVTSRFGGAAHDNFVWRNSPVRPYVEQLHQQNEHVWLLGDSGYPLRPWMMTPVLHPAENTPEARYNIKHKKARVVIENTFGRLKNRWRCCLKDRALHYMPTKCARIIVACCVLHNLAIQFGMPDPEEDEEYLQARNREFRRLEVLDQNGEEMKRLFRVAGRATRNNLIRRIDRY